MLNRMIEPVIGNRPRSASEALELLDGGALVRSKDGKLANSAENRGPWPAVGAAAIGVGGLAAGLIYIVFFDSFSETELVRISALWVAPVAFGVGVRRGGRWPLATGLVWSGLVVGLLILFIYGVFPSL
ncbi:MAG TPA: hypothetical protein ENJ18_09210 [Nannocystis exedens]|nr:hypothetical protein [Nannocystis exedens]